MKCLNKRLMGNAEGKHDLSGVRRNAIQMSYCINKMLVLKFPPNKNVSGYMY